MNASEPNANLRHFRGEDDEPDGAVDDLTWPDENTPNYEALLQADIDNIGSDQHDQ